jgi:hypothetical protein
MSAFDNLNDEQKERLMSFSTAILNNKDTRKDALLLAKKANPAFSSPELELEAQIEKVRKEEAEKRQVLSDQIQEREILRQRADKAKELKEQGFDIVAVEKVMTEQKIGSYETAIKFMKQEQQLAPATPASVTRMKMPDNVKDIMKNPNQWGRDTAHAVVDEILKGRVASR